MRLISQDGMVDVPYEKCCISIDYRCDTKIIAWFFGCEDEEIANMATYSTKDKCLKVMEMLRKAYVGLPVIMQNVEVEDEVIEKLKGNNVVLASIPNEKSNIDYINNGYFKFPADEEVEV